MWSYRIVAIAAVLAAVWTAVLVALPPAAAPEVVRYLLFLDTAGFGALFAVALLLFERVEGTDTARAVTPLKPGETMGVRIGMLTALAVAMAIPMIAVTAADRVWAAVGYTTAGITLTSVVLLAVCLGVGARTHTLQGALITIAAAIGPLVVVPVAHLAGVVQNPLMWVVPTTAGAELISHGVTGQAGVSSGASWVIAVAYSVGCAAAVCWWAGRPVRTLSEAPVRHGGSGGVRGAVAGVRDRAVAHRLPRRRVHQATRLTTTTHPVLGLVRHELFGARRDPLLLTVAVTPVPLALALRWGHPAVSEFLASAYAFDLAPYAPVVFGALILLHLPTMVGSVVALRVIEDIDDGALLALRVSPLSLPAYFGFRAMTAALLTLTGLAIATPLSGLAPERSAGLPISMAMAAAMAPLIVMVTAAYARNKVEAMVLLKGVAALSVLLPVLTWMLPTPWWTPLLALPPTWPLLALNAYPADTVPLGFILLGGLTSTAAASMALARRTRSRLLT